MFERNERGKIGGCKGGREEEGSTTKIDRKSMKTTTEGARYVSFYLREPIDSAALSTMPNHRIRCIRKTYRSRAGISVRPPAPLSLPPPRSRSFSHRSVSK